MPLITTRCPECGKVVRTSHDASWASCKAGHRFVPPTTGEIPTVRAWKAGARPNAWSVIHRRFADAIKSGHWDAGEQRHWYKVKWLPSIPSYGCSCEANWRELEQSKPIDWSSALTAFDSLWNLHNLVSTTHANNQPISLEQARRIWFGPKVAFITSSYLSVGGTEIFHRSLVPRIRFEADILGFGVTAFTGGDGSLLKVPFYEGVEETKKLIARADVVVTWGIDSLVDLMPEENRPKIISVHHSDHSSLWSNRLQAIPCVDHVVCVNEDTSRFLGKELKKPITFIANSVDPDRITPGPGAARLRELWGIPKDAKVVFYAHRLSEEKQPLKAIEIGNSMPDGYITVIAGDGDLARHCTPSEKVRVIGPLENLADWFSVSDCFISLSTYDGYGLSVAEALAYGIPTVSTPRGIAVGRAIPVEANDANEVWVKVIQDAVNTNPEKHDDLCNIDRFVGQWSDVIHGMVSEP